MEDQLTEISIEDLKRLRDLYTPDGTKSYTAFVTIDNYLRWTEQEQKANNGNIKFFCLNDDISNGTFAIVVSFIEICWTFDIERQPFSSNHLLIGF